MAKFYDKFDRKDKGTPENKDQGEKERSGRRPGSKKKFDPNRVSKKGPAPVVTGPIRLNRFIANAGICSRRDADELIKEGKIKVNGKVQTQMGVKVDPATDRIEYNNKFLHSQKFVYLLLNKPKNFITTTDDEKGRHTVMELVTQYTKERVYPVGRLDRNTTGLLLFTNDGDLAEKLTHPSNEIKKIYHVKLNKPADPETIQQLKQGLTLEDGFIKVDAADYVSGAGPDEIGVILHSGKNRVVRRIFDKLGFEVMALDRTGLGNLSKKGLSRGKARFLTEKEVAFIKMGQAKP